jgi:hypothetical protein
MRLLSRPPVEGIGRGLSLAPSGQLIAAVGDRFFAIDADWNWRLLGDEYAAQERESDPAHKRRL